MDEIDRKIAGLQEQKKQQIINKTKYEEFILDNLEASNQELYFYCNDAEIFKILCKERPFQYDAILLIKKALVEKNLPIIIEIVLQGFKLDKVERPSGYPSILIDDLYYEIVLACIESKDLNALRFFHENLTINTVMDLQVEIFEKSRETYYEIVKPYCDDKYFIQINQYKVKTPNDQHQLCALKNSKSERFTKYMEITSMFEGPIFDWIFDGFRKYCQIDSIYQRDSKIKNNLCNEIERLIKVGDENNLKTLHHIFDLRKLYDLSGSPSKCDHFKIIAALHGLNYYKFVANIFGHFQNYYDFSRFAFNIQIEVFEYMFVNLNWKLDRMNRREVRDTIDELILLAEKKNDRMLKFLLNFNYPWLSAQ